MQVTLPVLAHTADAPDIRDKAWDHWRNIISVWAGDINGDLYCFFATKDQWLEATKKIDGVLYITFNATDK